MKDHLRVISLVIIIIVLAIFLLNFRIENPNNNAIYISLDSPLEETSNFQGGTEEVKGLLPFRGVNFYPSPYFYDEDKAFDSLKELLCVSEINYVGLRFFLEQNDLKSVEVNYNPKNDIVLSRMIGMIHRAGKHICLEVDFNFRESNHYIADLDPTNIDEWFFSYKEALTHYAVFAQNNGVELLSIGNEMYSMFSFNDNWKEVITQTRKLYRGQVTAKLNCWWQEISFHKVMSWDWLSELDYIGIAPYFDLTKDNNLSLEELREAWQESRHGLNIISELEQIAEKHKRKIVFLEIGYRSIDGASIEPWNDDPVVPRGGGSGLLDQEEQSLATQALFDVFRVKDWWEGVFWFYWPTAKPLPEDKTWSLWNKPVESVIKNNFR